MSVAAAGSHNFQWRWIAAGLIADIIGLFVVPGYEWTGHPVQTHFDAY